MANQEDISRQWPEMRQLVDQLPRAPTGRKIFRELNFLSRLKRAGNEFRRLAGAPVRTGEDEIEADVQCSHALGDFPQFALSLWEQWSIRISGMAGTARFDRNPMA